MFLTSLRTEGSCITPRSAFGCLSVVRYYLLNIGKEISFLSAASIKVTNLV